MSNFFDSIKGAASGIRNVAQTYARDIVNEYMAEDGEGEGDDISSNQNNSDKKQIKQMDTEDNNKQDNLKSQPKKNDPASFFSSFLSQTNQKKEEVKAPEKPLQEMNPFKNIEKLAKEQKEDKNATIDPAKISKPASDLKVSQNKSQNDSVTADVEKVDKVEAKSPSKQEIKLDSEVSFKTPEKDKSHDEESKGKVDISHNLVSQKLSCNFDELNRINGVLLSLIKQYQEGNIKLERKDHDIMIDSETTDEERKETALSTPNEVKKNHEIIDPNQSPLKDQSAQDVIALQASAMDKFDKFWADVLKKYDSVVSSGMNSNIPDFEKLFKSLEKQEKKICKPFLKILAHSLQFLDKLETLDGKLKSLKNELSEIHSNADVSKSQLLEKQILKLQEKCNDFMDYEEKMKKEIKILQNKNKKLEVDLDTAAKDILHLRKLNAQVQPVIDPNSEVMREERDQLKKRTSELLKELQEKENIIEEMVLKIDELKEIEMKYLDSCDINQSLKKQIKDLEKDNELSRISLDNLQTALSEQQENYEWTMNQLENDKQAEFDQKSAKFVEEINELKSQLETKREDPSEVEGLQKQNEQLMGDIDHLVMQKEQISKELESIKDTLKTQELAKGHLIDRRVINHFLVQYLNHHNSDEIRKQMLQSMASMLDFSLEEKQVLGLIDQPNLEQKSDIGAKFLDFLMEDEDDE